MPASHLTSTTRTRAASIRRAGIAATLLCAGTTATMHAQLSWKQTTVESTPDPAAATVEARFRFTNDGTVPVDIEDIQTSCGCTTAKLEQRHFAPGEGGEIVALYTVGDHLGLQRKEVVVSCGDHTVTELALLVHLPELLRLEPSSVSWKPGEPARVKTIRLTVSPDTLKLDDLTVKASNTRVAAMLHPLVDGHQYELQLTPDSTGTPTLVTLLLRARFGTRENIFRAYATVQLPTTPPAGDLLPAAPPPAVR